MKPHLATIIAILAVGPGAAQERDRSILHYPPQRLVEIIDSSVRDVVAAAAVNVVHDAAQKRLRILASSPGATRGTIRVEEFGVETVFDSSFLPAEKAAPLAYHCAHNALVFSFACAQLAAGKTDLATRIFSLLAQAQPTLRLVEGGSEVTVGEFLTHLQRKSERGKQILKEYKESWESHLKEHGL